MVLRLPAVMAVFLSLAASACTSSTGVLDGLLTAAARPGSHSASDRECLARAMYFESHRSSRDGLIAVGTVVMNRVESDQYPDTICGVVAQKKQFAPGVMTRRMDSKALPDVMAAADAVLKGERHPKVKRAMFFHQAGLSFPYSNMHYVLVAGGNAFYEKRSRAERRQSQAELVAATRPAAPTAKADTATALSFDREQQETDAIGAVIAGEAQTVVAR